MTWNYRIIKHDTSKSVFYAVHEVFYLGKDQGKADTWTVEPIDITGESKDDISVF